MEHIIGNYLNQPNRDFPLDCETLEYIQGNQTLLSILGNLAGDKAIIFGCELNEAKTERGPGYIFLHTVAYPQGELLPWEGGRLVSGMYLKEENISVSSQGYQYAQAYTKRSLAPGIGVENYKWEDFKEIKTTQQLEQLCADLQKQLDAVRPTPFGIPEMWAGYASPDALPENYALCDGTVLSIQAYPELYAVIGRLHTPSNIQTGYFSLPDLRSRFIVGFNPNDEDHNTIGGTGGAKKVTLSEDEMPAHTHEFKDYYYIETTGTGGGVDGSDPVGRNVAGSKGTDWNNNSLWYKKHQTYESGSGLAHENRPPYYTLAYIIRVK